MRGHQQALARLLVGRFVGGVWPSLIVLQHAAPRYLSHATPPALPGYLLVSLCLLLQPASWWIMLDNTHLTRRSVSWRGSWHAGSM